MAPNPRRQKPRAAALATYGELSNDRWQHQADAAAWSVISGMAPSLYLGAIEPIPVPADLRARMREAGRALAAEPSQVRADALLRMAHEAAYGAPAPESLFPVAVEHAGGVSGGDWWDTPGAPEKPLAASLEAFASEAFAALHAAEPDPEGAGEQQEGDWW